MNISKKNLTVVIVALAAVVALVAGQAGAAISIRVSQESSPGAGDFSSNVLGTITAKEYSAGTASDYYNYGYEQFRGPWPTLVDRRTHMFFVNATDGLSLFVVHDKAGGPAGGDAQMKFVLSGDADGADWLVQDDPPSGGDVYTSNSGVFTASWGWDAIRDDGGAIGSLDGSAWSILAEFTAAPTGLDEMVAYSADESTIALDMTVGRRVLYEVVPEPATMSLLALGGVAMLRRRRKR